MISQIKISSSVLQIEQELISVRRDLHRIPEIGFEERKTAAYVRDYLSKIQGLTIDEPLGLCPTAVVARIGFESLQQSKQKAYFFRCELDALPFKEQSGLPYSSSNNSHHACGHDGHMAGLLLSIKLIALKRQFLAQPIIFCFQPAEEGLGGAHRLLHAFPKILDPVKHCFAVHFGNHKKVGVVCLSQGYVSSSSRKFTIIVRGKSAHPMLAHSAIDANYIGCGLVTNLYSLQQRKLNPTQKAILVVTKIEGGIGTVSISDRFIIHGSLRCPKPDTHRKMQKYIQNQSVSYSQAFGATCQAPQFNQDTFYYRPVYNDEEPTSMCQQVWKDIGVSVEKQEVGFFGQDFCQFSQKVPSCYCLLGSALNESLDLHTKESLFPAHSNRHKFQQKAMLLICQFWVSLALGKNLSL